MKKKYRLKTIKELYNEGYELKPVNGLYILERGFSKISANLYVSLMYMIHAKTLNNTMINYDREFFMEVK